MARAVSCRGRCLRSSSSFDMGNRSLPGSTTTLRSTAPTMGGFGRNERKLPFHNAQMGAEGAVPCTVHPSPGTFYDSRWSTTLARRDKINTQAGDRRASGPDGNGGLVQVAGDFRELQGTMWTHDHRFFFTAENVYKGNLGMVNFYSGPDRGNEALAAGVNFRLP